MEAHQAPLSLGFSRQEHWSGLTFPSPVHESEKWKWSCLVVSDSSRPHGLQPTRLLHPWDFRGKSTGVGCHCLLWNSSIVFLKLKLLLEESLTVYSLYLRGITAERCSHRTFCSFQWIWKPWCWKWHCLSHSPSVDSYFAPKTTQFK